MWFVKFFCWVGWHVWEYFWKDRQDNISHVSLDGFDNERRRCKICKVEQAYLSQKEGWTNDQT